MDHEEPIYRNYISSHFGNFHDFDREMKSSHAMFRRNYLSHLPKDKNARIVDLGCGMGHMLYSLQKEGYKNFIGVDRSDENVVFCKQHNFPIKKATIVDFLQTDKTQTDVFILNDVIEHFPIDEGIAVLKLMKERLSENGLIIVKTPNGGHPFLAGSSMYQDITHKFCFTEVSLSQILSVAGFGRVSIHPQDIYVFYKNPINYIAIAVVFILNLLFRILFLLYGKRTIKIFSKHLIAVAKP